jgi:phosphoribosylanthranilate isomerase
MSLELGVKVCGATTEADIRKAELSGASSVGVIIRPDATYHNRSANSHSINPRRAKRLREATPAGMKFVAVMRTGLVHEITDIADTVEPDRVQISQTHNPFVSFGVMAHYAERDSSPEIAQVIHVDEWTTPEVVDNFVPYVDYIHLDSGPQPGGNGVPHDWIRSAAIAERAHEKGKLVILAGGLVVENVSEAIQLVKPDGVDVETGIRTHNVYNQKMIRDFVDAAV